MPRFFLRFISTEYHLSRYWNALFSAGVVALTLLLSRELYAGIFAGAFVIAAQSVSGINRQGAFRIRLTIAVKTVFILFFTAFLGGVAAVVAWPVALLLGVLLAFGFAWCRQLFPVNWPDIVIPSAVLFFSNYAEPALWPTLHGALLGLGCELLLGVGMFLKKLYFPSPRFRAERELFPPPPQKEDRLVLGLKSYLFLYAVELSLLLCAGFTLIRLSPYPHAYWMPLTCVMVLKVGRHGTLRRVVERTLGTLAGCVLGSAWLFLSPGLWPTAVVMVGCIFTWLCFLRTRYALGTIFITTFVLLLMGSSHPFSFGMVAERLVFTVLGGTLTLLSSLLFLGRDRLRN